MRGAVALSTFVILALIGAAECTEAIELYTPADTSEAPEDLPRHPEAQRVSTELRQPAEPPSERTGSSVDQQSLLARRTGALGN